MPGSKFGDTFIIHRSSPDSRPPSANRPPSGKLINIVSNEDTCYKERLTINIMVFFLK